jgi:DNA ligase (NAD+)
VLAAHAGTLEILAASGEEELTNLRGVGPEIAASVTAFFRQEENRRIVAALTANGVRAVPESGDASAGAGPLAGLSFVFTGTLNSLSREQAQDLVARAGGRSVASVSRATSYVVVGSDPGSKALQAEKLGVPRLSDSAFLALLKEKGIS